MRRLHRGIGENSASLRARVKARPARDRTDAAAGRRAAAHRCGKPHVAWVIPTNEELMIARNAQSACRGATMH
jgi:acetate kinase